ncbi:MAG: hypothetical protein OXP36_12305 [Gammaproteobacteria bacterium]|nr:hypothetical protein [Gammaproteobacteria bacterium]
MDTQARRLTMLNSSVRREALENLKKSVDEHVEVRENATEASAELFSQRRRATGEVIGRVEAYINTLANSPKEFDKTVDHYRVEAGRFESRVEQLEAEAAQSDKVGKAGGAAGAAFGVGVAALGPSVAVAIATTFGTASTGMAISALSGAAATNAALAWLGGGALAAGGGGMAAGKVLLALAGPVGWTVAGAALVGAAAYLRYQNRKQAEEATQRRIEVEAEIRSLRAAMAEIEALTASVIRHADGCLGDLDWLEKEAPRDYRQFGKSEKQRLMALVNNIQSLGKLLSSKVAYGQA